MPTQPEGVMMNPIKRSSPVVRAPLRDVKARTYRPTGSDGFTGPSYSELRGNTDVVPVGGKLSAGSVRRSGVNPHNRGWFR